MCQTHQHHEQGQLGETVLANRGGDAEFLGNLFECKEETKDWAESGVSDRKMIEVTSEGATESLDTSGIPFGDICESTGFDLPLVAEGFADQDGRRRGTIWNSGDIHALYITSLTIYVKGYYYTYMPT